MSSSKLQVSLATENDSKDILLWRNDKTTLLYTPSSRKISQKNIIYGSVKSWNQKITIY